MKRSSKTKKIGELLSDFFNKNNQSSVKKHFDPFKMWINIMGRQIISETHRVSLEEDTLYVIIKNPYLRSDLKSQTEIILKEINLKYPFIQKIIFK